MIPVDPKTLFVRPEMSGVQTRSVIGVLYTSDRVPFSFLSKLSQSEIGQFIGEFYQVRYYLASYPGHVAWV